MDNSQNNQKRLNDLPYPKTIAIDFAKWIGENKWFKQIRYDIWEKTGTGSKTSSELYDMFISNYPL